jgi:hypothetical protein
MLCVAEAYQGIPAYIVAIMDRLDDNDEAEIPIRDETTVPGSSAGSVSYPAIIALIILVSTTDIQPK